MCVCVHDESWHEARERGKRAWRRRVIGEKQPTKHETDREEEQTGLTIRGGGQDDEVYKAINRSCVFLP